MNSLITLAKQRGYLTEVAVCCVADRRRWIYPQAQGRPLNRAIHRRYDLKTGKRVNKNVLGKTQVEVREKLKTAMAEVSGVGCQQGSG